MQKPISKAELEKILAEAIASHPECQNCLGPQVLGPVPPAGRPSNWDAIWSGEVNIKHPPACEKLVLALQQQYVLTEG